MGVVWFVVAFGSLLGLGGLSLMGMGRPARPATVSGAGRPEGGDHEVPPAAFVVDAALAPRFETVPDPAVRARVRRLLDEAGVDDLRDLEGALRVTFDGNDYRSIAAIPDPAVRAQLHELLGDVVD
ncbi:MAG: hypothetical protein KatS3mg010_0488 [Acidimicrobiia bacterium]|nr:MAG: hypothetical protein KatS3mg010_0488 [Acidimicrobiia bacterium]